MPIYEYACGACGVVFEELIRGKTDEEELRCPKCGAGPAQLGRQMSVFGVQGDVQKPISSSSGGSSGCSGCSSHNCSGCH